MSYYLNVNKMDGYREGNFEDDGFCFQKESRVEYEYGVILLRNFLTPPPTPPQKGRGVVF
jgi:hypothetical protein